jgi:hypothetical protein
MAWCLVKHRSNFTFFTFFTYFTTAFLIFHVSLGLIYICLRCKSVVKPITLRIIEITLTFHFIKSLCFFFLIFLMLFSGVGFFFLLMDPFRHLVGVLGRGISPAQGLYLHRTTQHRETQTHIHAPSRIRTCDPNVRAAEDSICFRPRGYWDRLYLSPL